MEKLQARVQNVADPRNQKPYRLTVKDVESAERVVLKLTQKNAFKDEMKTLSANQLDATDRQSIADKNRVLRKSSRLHRLDPYMDDHGLIRVGGRIKRSELSIDNKHPVILPRKHHVTTLIISHYHQKVQHQGRGMTLSELRANGYWILHGCAAVTSYISSCVTCRRLRRPPEDG